MGFHGGGGFLKLIRVRKCRHCGENQTTAKPTFHTSIMEPISPTCKLADEICLRMIFVLSNPRRPTKVRVPEAPVSRPARNGPIAQLVEQRIENPRVAGSNPARATIRACVDGLTSF